MSEVLQVPEDKIKTYRLDKRCDPSRPLQLKVCFGNVNDKHSFMKAQKSKRISTESLEFLEKNNIFLDHDDELKGIQNFTGQLDSSKTIMTMNLYGIGKEKSFLEKMKTHYY